MQQFHFRIVQIPRWQIVLMGAVVLALFAALTVVTFGILLLVLPVFLVLGALASLFGGRPISQREHADQQTIDADYRVIEEKRIDSSRGR
jgi:hypothetical protein